MKQEPYTPKAGDRVRITKSNVNWHPDMDEYVGKVVVVTAVVLERNGITVHIQFEGIQFEGCGKWYWMYQCGHFEPYEELYYTLY